MGVVAIIGGCFLIGWIVYILASDDCGKYDAGSKWIQSDHFPER